MKIKTKDPAAELSLNLAPMIDVVFLLLIFFMVATTFANEEKELPLDLPAAESGEQAADERDEIIVNITGEGRIVIDDETVDRARMEEIFARAARADRETPVTIRGDGGSDLQVTTEVIDVARLAGLMDVGIMTVER